MRVLLYLFVSTCLLVSCQKENTFEDQQGISIKTLKSGGSNSDGFALDFDFNEFESEFDEVLEQLGLSQNDNSIFADFFKYKLFVLTTGDGVCDEDIMANTEVFSLGWLNDTKEDIGTFEAFGAMINITDPEDLENGLSFSRAQDLSITVEEVNDNQIIGTFSGTVGGESIEGRFDVPRQECGN